MINAFSDIGVVRLTFINTSMINYFPLHRLSRLFRLEAGLALSLHAYIKKVLCSLKVYIWYICRMVSTMCIMNKILSDRFLLMDTDLVNLLDVCIAYVFIGIYIFFLFTRSGLPKPECATVCCRRRQ